MGDVADYSVQPRPREVEGAVSAHDLVVEDIKTRFSYYDAASDLIHSFMERKDFGFKKYGVILHHKNGRNHALDALEEVQDLIVYFRNMLDSDPACSDVFKQHYDAMLHAAMDLMRRVKNA